MKKDGEYSARGTGVEVDERKGITFTGGDVAKVRNLGGFISVHNLALRYFTHPTLQGTYFTETQEEMEKEGTTKWGDDRLVRLIHLLPGGEGQVAIGTSGDMGLNRFPLLSR